MKVGIIGAGFGGLAAGYWLARNKADVTIFESDDKPGGLAVGFQAPKWRWSMEWHYHHWFTNDHAILNLAKEIGYPVVTVHPKTSTYYNGRIYQLDSPISLLKFSELSFFDRIRTGMVIAYLKLNPNWKMLEGITAKDFLIKYMGQKSWDVLWYPLFIKKFDKYYDKIAASWFWTRINKRTPSLVYPEGGFIKFALALDRAVREHNGTILYKTPVLKVEKKGNKFMVKTNRSTMQFDKVMVTLPTPIFTKIVDKLPLGYKKELQALQGIGAVNLVLSLKHKFLEDGTYWLNINDTIFPFLALVEHTNFMDKKRYNNEHLLYIGNYLPQDHKYFVSRGEDLFSEFLPYLKTINPSFNKSWVNKIDIFKAPFAQPIIPLNYSKNIPKFETPIKGLYLCNIQQVYPWDRGTNYAVELGQKVAKIIND